MKAYLERIVKGIAFPIVGIVLLVIFASIGLVVDAKRVETAKKEAALLKKAMVTPTLVPTEIPLPTNTKMPLPTQKVSSISAERVGSASATISPTVKAIVAPTASTTSTPTVQQTATPSITP